MTERSTASNIAAHVRGAGETVVLVHGALGDHRQWAPIADRLAAACRVAAISRRHHWPAPPPPLDTPYTYERHCDDLLDHLRDGAAAVHLVGHSYGAGIVLLAALQEPALIRTLTLIEPPFGSLLPPDAPALDEEIASRKAMLNDVQSLARAGEAERATRTLIDWLQGGAGGFDRLPPETRRGLLDNASTVGPTFLSPAPEVPSDRLRELGVPTLVLAGERTRAYFRAIAQTVAACVPGAEAATIPDAGHMVIVERPAETAAALLAFLARGH